MVGFSGVSPILTFIEQGIGLEPDTPNNVLTWRINSTRRSGCERFRFNGHIIDLIASPTENDVKISVRSDGEFKLIMIHSGKEKIYSIVKGENEYVLSNKKSSF
jgi:hypothetical protein